jgi:hypothetical protein
MSGAKLGRENISWVKPPLLWWKTLGVLIAKTEGIPVTPSHIETLHSRTADLFPAVTKLAGERFTERDVIAACKRQGREYSLNKFLGRVDSAMRWDERLDTKAIRDAYSKTRPRRKAKTSRKTRNR